MRKWVLPILRIVIFAVIAAALVKVAFFGDASTQPDPTTPTGAIIESQAVVTVGTIRNDVVLDATIAADDAVGISATLAGEVREVLVAQGAAVAAGQDVLRIRAEVQNADGGVSTKWATVKAPVAGILSSFTALVGQSFSVGDTVGKVAPPTFSVVGTIDPSQQYRLLNNPVDALVSITGGPAPFTCSGLSITAALAGAAPDDVATSGGTTVRCSVPAGVVVFAGLAAELTIAGGLAENVLTLPVTAVQGTTANGIVFFILPDGTTEERPVTLGINDGRSVQVVDGVAEGDAVLQYVPGLEIECDPNTGLGCEG